MIFLRYLLLTVFFVLELSFMGLRFIGTVMFTKLLASPLLYLGDCSAIISTIAFFRWWIRIYSLFGDPWVFLSLIMLVFLELSSSDKWELLLQLITSSNGRSLMRWSIRFSSWSREAVTLWFYCLRFRSWSNWEWSFFESNKEMFGLLDLYL
jgi:hypothetical protein